MPEWTPVFLSPDVPLPKGPYSPAVRAGDFVFVSGQTPRDPVSGELGASDVASQARATLANVQRVLREAGAGLGDVVSVTLYLQRMDDWSAVNEIYKEFFVAPYPSRTAIGCDLRDILIEISAVAWTGRAS
jgi:2-iminobutanoate/2-iminopropanoate deaminase